MVLMEINGHQHQTFVRTPFPVGDQPPATHPYLRIEQSSAKSRFESLGRLPGTTVPACRRVSCWVARSPRRTATMIEIATSFRCRRGRSCLRVPLRLEPFVIRLPPEVIAFGRVSEVLADGTKQTILLEGEE